MSERVREDEDQQPPSEEASYLLDECRMVLPGIQALFGFQLVAVFNQTFWERLSSSERTLHLVAIALIAVAVALVMTPAAYHRQTERDSVSHAFIRIASRLLLLSMWPLLLGICLDFYLIANLILQDTLVSLVLAALLLGVFLALWFLLPRIAVLRHMAQRASSFNETRDRRRRTRAS